MRIDSVGIPNGTGRIGICACPGAQRSPFGGHKIDRDLDRDLDAIRDWGALGLVTLVQQHELDTLGVLALPERTGHHTMWWLHLPIPDMGAPDARFEACWARESPRLYKILSVGGRIMLHCWAGLGRTGTVAARMLIDQGVAPMDAIRRVRAARPGTIQSRQQEQYLLRLHPRVSRA